MLSRLSLTQIAAILLMIGLALGGILKFNEMREVKAAPVIAKEPEPKEVGIHVVILDVRKSTEDCGTETLMEAIEGANYRYSRCGYFGAVGDKFWWYEK